ncbi:MAG: type II toxin-antitoxin system RelE/ParE family toxin [Candidatus Binatia bacterium]
MIDGYVISIPVRYGRFRGRKPALKSPAGNGAPVEVHPEAVLEAQSAYRWYRDRNDVPAPHRILGNEFDGAVQLCKESLWPIHLHGTRHFLLRRFPFGVVYRELGETLQIVAVAHGRRRPGYWKDR